MPIILKALGAVLVMIAELEANWGLLAFIP